MSHGLWPVSPLNHTYGQTLTPLCYLPLPFFIIMAINIITTNTVVLISCITQTSWSVLSTIEEGRLLWNSLKYKLRLDLCSPVVQSIIMVLLSGDLARLPLLSETEVTIWQQSQNQDPSHHHWQLLHHPFSSLLTTWFSYFWYIPPAYFAIVTFRTLNLFALSLTEGLVASLEFAASGPSSDLEKFWGWISLVNFV